MRTAHPPQSFAGLRELVDALARSGIPLSIASGGRRERIDEELTQQGLRERLAEVFGFPTPKAQVIQAAQKALGAAGGTVVMIGDAPHDMQEAQQVPGTVRIGFLPDPTRVVDVTTFGADFYLRDYAEVTWDGSSLRFVDALTGEPVEVRNVRAVVFDYDGTFVDSRALNEQLFGQLALEAAGLSPDAPDAPHVRALGVEAWHRTDGMGGEMTVEEVLHAVDQWQAMVQPFQEAIQDLQRAAREGEPVTFPIFTAQAVRGGVESAGRPDEKKRLPSGVLPHIPAKQVSFVPVGYDSFEASAKALTQVYTAFNTLIEQRLKERPLTSLKELLELMAKAIEQTPGAEGVFLAIDMGVDELRAADGTYYLGADAGRFGSEAQDGFVRHQLLLEYYQMLATDLSRLIAIEHSFAHDDTEAWAGGRSSASLEEIALDPDPRFVSVPAQALVAGGEAWAADLRALSRRLAEQGMPPQFHGTTFLLRQPESGVETRILRVTLEGRIKRASLRTAAEYPPGSCGASLAYQPVHTSMGTSGFRGRVENMRDVEPYAIARAFARWLVRTGQYQGDQQTGLPEPGQAMVLAGDYRDSTPAFAAAVLKAVQELGLEVDYLGNVPTPAMAYYCQRMKRPGIMITGSHTEGKYNGLKLYDVTHGEVLNEPIPWKGETVAHRDALMAAAEEERQRLYQQPAAEVPFDAHGDFKPGQRPTLPPAQPSEKNAQYTAAEQLYIDRHVQAFPGRPFAGYAIVYWVHSTVGAPTHIAILEALGMKVLRVGERGKDFIALDTENMTKDHLKYLKEQVEQVKGDYQGREDAQGRVWITIDGQDYLFVGLTSSDGDADRSVLVDEKGRFWRGDVTTALAAEILGAKVFVQSLSGSEDARLYLKERGITFIDSSVGSPYHVFIMLKQLLDNPGALVAGGEVNGGLFLGPNFILPNGQPIEKLLTRAALLPTLMNLWRAKQEQRPVSWLFEGTLDHFADAAGLIHEMPAPPGTKPPGTATAWTPAPATQ